jgi:hypothetical protein
MIRRHFVSIDAGELPHLRSEPVLIGPLDIFGLIKWLDLIGGAPGWRTATSVFLRDGKGKPLVESSGQQRHRGFRRTRSSTKEIAGLLRTVATRARLVEGVSLTIKQDRARAGNINEKETFMPEKILPGRLSWPV